MSKTVLISINTSWNIYNFRAPLITALKNAGYRVVTAAPNDAYSARLRPLVDAHIHLPMQNAGTSFLQDVVLFWRYLRVLRAVKPAVMLTYTIKPNIYGSLAARVLGIPVINNVSGLGTVFLRGGWLAATVKPLYWLAFRGSTRVFFQNQDDHDLFVQMKLVAPAKARVLPGSGIDLAYFHPSHAPARDVHAPIAFVLIARQVWDKGIAEYIAAARIIKAQQPSATFRLLGPIGVANKTAIDARSIDAWVAEGVIEYWGETDDVRSVIAQHDCVVLPSYREGLSRVLLEAAAMGKPLIATDVPGCKQVIDAGINGFLCAPYDAQSLADAMVRFMQLTPQERMQMGMQSRAKAEREFDQAQVLDAYLVTIAAIIAP
jgi:glycosyltransferase involved in cell wall biosynthesis